MEQSIVIHLGAVADIPLGQGVCFIVKGEEIAVFRSRMGEIFAVANKCPHRQGPLAEGIIGNGKVVCPLHGHKFDLKTGEGSESHECVQTFKVWEENGQIMLEDYWAVEEKVDGQYAELILNANSKIYYKGNAHEFSKSNTN